jgi:hypothetical protein
VGEIFVTGGEPFLLADISEILTACDSPTALNRYRDGTLAGFLKPDLSPAERAVAQVEGWILGVPGLIRVAGQREDSATATAAACDPSLFRLH